MAEDFTITGSNINMMKTGHRVFAIISNFQRQKPSELREDPLYIVYESQVHSKM